MAVSLSGVLWPINFAGVSLMDTAYGAFFVIAPPARE
jgi:hypothetical protein